MKLSAFKTDTARAEAGDWIDIKALPGVSFKVRGRHTVAAKAIRAKLNSAIPLEDRADAEAMIRHQERIEAEVILSCLDDWKGLVGDDDAPLAYSQDAAKAIVLDPDFNRLVSIIGAACDMVQERREAAIEDAAKN